ncbi:uncharacterized protein METZ01_LOCUS366450 [marine metagenome]|uniref:DUF3310 domain-containing protein n=1 Tax=marine metagenome TaxID=408172 RepID=A0A382SUN9_9ZZZZ
MPKTDGQLDREAKEKLYKQGVILDQKLKGEMLDNHMKTLEGYNNINSPSHYNQGRIECIDAIEAMLSIEEYIGYLRGNSAKYRWRFRYKNGVEDLKKAEWYEKRLIKFMEAHDVVGQKS